MLHLSRLILLPLTGMVLLSGCADDEAPLGDTAPQQELPMAEGRRTVILYVSAQNSLGHNRFQESDSIEVAQGARYLNDNDRLVVYMDDARSPRIYHYTRHDARPRLVHRWEKDLNSSSPATLEEVLTWTRRNFPAREYGLVMWSHSDGWLPATNKHYGAAQTAPKQPFSFGIDVGADGNMRYDEDAEGNIGPQMDITDMAAAIARSGIHFEYIFFDSCLMQTLESDYDLRHAANYIIAGPMQIPGCGADYTHLLRKGLFTRAEEDIVDTYYKDASEGFDRPASPYYDYGLIMASVRTDRLQALAETLSEVLPRSAAKQRTSADMDGVQQYQAYCANYFYRPHHYDAAIALERLLDAPDYRRVSAALNAAIVRKAATPSFWMGPYAYSMNDVDLDRYCGVALFVPQQEYAYNAQRCVYGDLNEVFRETAWYKAAGWEKTGW